MRELVDKLKVKCSSTIFKLPTAHISSSLYTLVLTSFYFFSHIIVHNFKHCFKLTNNLFNVITFLSINLLPPEAIWDSHTDNF